jgi:peptide/nickel transport system substrate-binding protein
MTGKFRGKKFRLLAASGLMATGLLAVGLTGITASTALASAKPHVSVPLVMESSPTPSVTDNFNPFSTGSAVTLLGATSLIYEPMLQFDVANPAMGPYDFLATGYSWSNGGKTITFRVRAGVQFNDGSSLTPGDVAFTYNLLKKWPALNTTGLAIVNAVASRYNVAITFSSSQYTNLQNVASVYILPDEAPWNGSTDPSSATITDPVGTGPYMLASNGFTSQGFTLTANPNYWGGPFGAAAGPPAVSTVEFPALTSNTTVLGNLDGNTLDWAGNFITGLQKAFVNPSPATHHVWFAPVNTVTLYPNLQVWPTNQLAVREAISLAISRNTLSAQGESGFEPPASNASGLTLPNFANLISPSVAKMTLAGAANPKAADAVLKAAGYTKNGQGWFEKSGKVVSISVTDPSAYTDYAADDLIVVKNLQAAGIQATFDGTTPAAWGSAVGSGNYQLTTHWGTTSIAAYQLYNYWLNSSLYTSSPKSVSGDFERLDNAAMDAALTKLASATTLAAQKADLAPIEQYVATQLPVIPVLYGAAFDEYNSSNFTGWPTAANPYESGSPNTPTNEVVVLHLKPTS